MERVDEGARRMYLMLGDRRDDGGQRKRGRATQTKMECSTLKKQRVERMRMGKMVNNVVLTVDIKQAEQGHYCVSWEKGG